MAQTLSRTACAALALMLAAACSPKSEAPSASAPPAAPSLTDASTVGEVHRALITPGSDALFAAEATPPTSEEGWRAVEAAAQKVVDGAALLQTGARPRDKAGWMRISKAVEDGARKSLEAARSKNIEALQMADGDFLAQCEDCHKIYRDAGGGMMADPGK
jgi:hypothetical protein